MSIMTSPKAQSYFCAETNLLGRRSFPPFTEFNKIEALSSSRPRHQIFSFDNRWLSAHHPHSPPVAGLRISPMKIPNLRNVSKNCRRSDLVEKLGLQSQERPVSPRERHHRGSPAHVIAPLRVRSEAMPAAAIFPQPAKLRRNKTEIIVKADSSMGDNIHKARNQTKKTGQAKLKGDVKGEKSVVGKSHSQMSELKALHKHGSTPAMALKKSESLQGNSKARQAPESASIDADKDAKREPSSSYELDKMSKRKQRKRQPLEGRRRPRPGSGKTIPTEQADVSQTVAQGKVKEDMKETSRETLGPDETIVNINNKNEEKVASIKHAVSDSAMTDKEPPRHRGKKLRKKKRGVKNKNTEITEGGRDSTSMPDVTPHDRKAVKYPQESKRDKSSPRAASKKTPSTQLKAIDPVLGRNKQSPLALSEEFPLLRFEGSELLGKSPDLVLPPHDPMIAKVEVARIEERKSKRSPRKSRKSSKKSARRVQMEMGGPKSSQGQESLLQEDVTFRHPHAKRSLSSPCKEKASPQRGAIGEAGAFEDRPPAASVSLSSVTPRCKTMSEILEILCKHLDGNRNKQSLEMLPVQLRQYCEQNAARRHSGLPGLPKTYQQLGLKPLVRSMSSENYFPRLALQWRSDKPKKRRRHRASRTASARGSLKTSRPGKKREEKHGMGKTRKKKVR